MRKDAREADRRQEVRGAARAWHRARAVDLETRDAILSEYADDRVRVGTAFRVLLFVFTLLAGGAAFGLLAVGGFSVGGGLFFMALASIALTEVQIGTLRRSSAGAEEATAILSLGFSYATLVWASDTNGLLPWRFLFVATAGLAAAAAFRWGMSLFGAVSAICLFAALAFWPGARLSWFALGSALAPPLSALSVSPALAPSHRRAADAALVIALAALYGAVHLGGYDSGLLESELFSRGLDFRAPDRWARPAFILATALVPPAVLAAGILWRRPLFLRMGLLFGIASLVTLRFYVHVAPLWVVLTSSGALAIAVGLLLERYLRTGPRKERRGFTADPLFGGEPAAGVLEAGLSAALAPEARPSPSVEPGFRGGGGKFGGGGATGGY